MIFFFDNSQLVVRNLPDFYLEVYLKLPPWTLQGGGCDTPPNPPSSYGPEYWSTAFILFSFPQTHCFGLCILALLLKTVFKIDLGCSFFLLLMTAPTFEAGYFAPHTLVHMLIALLCSSLSPTAVHGFCPFCLAQYLCSHYLN